jgi:ketosteroid isomerase-like protein
MDSNTILTRLAWIQEIKELNAKYNFAVDDCDADAWASCFTADGVFNALLEGEKPRGTDQLKAFVRTVNDAFGKMNHLTTNELITFDGETASQKCYLLFFYKKNGQLEGSICVYDDALQRENGEWKYRRRNVEVKAKFADIKD